jgi:hypothetical protein
MKAQAVKGAMKKGESQVLVAHTYNPRYSRRQKSGGLRFKPAWANSLGEFILTHHKKGWE